MHRALTVLALLLLAGCGVRMRPDYQMPQPLLQPMSAKVGLLLDEPLRRYVHEETRAGGNWRSISATGTSTCSATCSAPRSSRCRCSPTSTRRVRPACR